MKRIIALLLLVVMICMSLCSCDKEKSNDNMDKTTILASDAIVSEKADDDSRTSVSTTDKSDQKSDSTTKAAVTTTKKGTVTTTLKTGAVSKSSTPTTTKKAVTTTKTNVVATKATTKATTTTTKPQRNYKAEADWVVAQLIAYGKSKGLTHNPALLEHEYAATSGAECIIDSSTNKYEQLEYGKSVIDYHAEIYNAPEFNVHIMPVPYQGTVREGGYAIAICYAS